MELDGHIRFIGIGTQKGSWDGVYLNGLNTANEFAYCDFINGGSRTDDYNYPGVLNIESSKVSITHCTVSGGKVHGITLWNNSEITAFNNNKVENCDHAPVYIKGSFKLLEKFDMTSIFTGNAKQYIQVNPAISLSQDASISQTSVPYYFTNATGTIDAKLQINEGVIIYMGDGVSLNFDGAPSAGRLIFNGTAEKKIRFTRLPGAAYYWNHLNFRGLTGSVINHCIFEYGGRYDGTGIIEIASNADLTLNNVEINNSYNYGVRIVEVTPAITYHLVHSNVTFANNNTGNVFVYFSNEVLVHFP